ncbi:hypothetical protein [Nostoc sp. 2RC]|uniref:hypothetical protein n=1 Tax=Nostoc sp. 2RC TaxID=2485484 RepID=UPI0021AB894F|nr:hypothetical protein [Nostoc sp. 2RC]
MKIFSKIAIYITLLIGVAILIISIYPGALNSFFFPVMLVSIVCVPFAVLAILFWGLRTLELIRKENIKKTEPHFT